MATWFGLSRLFGKRGNARTNGPSTPSRAPAAIEPLEPRTLLSAAAPAAAAPAPAQTISFSATQRIEDVSAFNGYIATGDFTGNGLTDFASTRGFANNIFIYLNNGNDTFTHAETYHVNDPRGIIAGDFNNDGITDLAVVAENSNNGTNATNAAIFILFGNGDGTFSAPVKVAKTRQGFGAITASDLTNNGLLDLVVTNDRAVSVYMNQGNGTFATAIRYNTSIGNAAYVSAEDLNGDGVPDLVIGKGQQAFVSVLLAQTINGQPTGVFEPFTKYHTNNLPISVAVGDLGPGTLPDIITANNGFRQGVSVLVNNGDGTFGPQTVFPAGNFPRYVAVGDFSGDGEDDVASTDFDGPLYVFEGESDGTLSTPQLFNSGRQGDFLTPIQLGTGPESILVSHSGAVTVLLNTTPVVV